MIPINQIRKSSFRTVPADKDKTKMPEQPEKASLDQPVSESNDTFINKIISNKLLP